MPRIERIPVKVGQVWQDCDKRMNDRRIVIVEVNEAEGYCYAISEYDHERGAEHPRRIRLLLRRMHPHSTGFRFLTYPYES